jgi:outer membrane protein
MINFLKNKITIVLFVSLVWLGIMGTVQPSSVYAAVPTSPVIGVVDFNLLLNQHPDTQKANDTLKVEADSAQKEFEAKSVNMSDKDKQNLNLQLRQRVEQKRQDLLKAIADKISISVKEVAEAEGVSIVVQKGVVVYEASGVDITDEVLKKIRQ